MYIVIDTRIGLGDALVYAMLANSLAKAGYRVVVISKYLHHFAHLIKSYRVLLPEGNDCAEACYQSDVILTTQSQDIHHQDKTVLIGIDHKCTASWLPSKNHPFSPCHGQNLCRKYHQCTSMPQLWQNFLDDTIGGNLIVSTGIKWPQSWLHHKYSKRVLLAPYYSGSHLGEVHRSWALARWHQLAQRCLEDGFEVIWLMTDAEKSITPSIILNQYTVLTPSLMSSAQLMYESAVLVGACSGSSWLASSAKLPTVNLYYVHAKNKRRKLLWQKCFSKHKVISQQISPLLRWVMSLLAKVVFRLTSQHSLYFGQLKPSVGEVFNEVKSLLQDKQEKYTTNDYLTE
ncbi:MAG: hypothetical protein ACON5A_02090 [Candidatus Comchoanobacterales bacterium]